MKAETGKQSLGWHVGTREGRGAGWGILGIFFKALRIQFMHITVFFNFTGWAGGEAGRVTDITMSNLGN